jgi:hypothetical protein
MLGASFAQADENGKAGRKTRTKFQVHGGATDLGAAIRASAEISHPSSAEFAVAQSAFGNGANRAQLRLALPDLHLKRAGLNLSGPASPWGAQPTVLNAGTQLSLGQVDAQLTSGKGGNSRLIAGGEFAVSTNWAEKWGNQYHQLSLRIGVGGAGGAVRTDTTGDFRAVAGPTVSARASYRLLDDSGWGLEAAGKLNYLHGLTSDVRRLLTASAEVNVTRKVGEQVEVSAGPMVIYNLTQTGKLDGPFSTEGAFIVGGGAGIGF